MFFAGAFWELILGYFQRHLALYLALVLLFATGLGFGALATQKLSPVQREDLSHYLKAVYASLAETTPGRGERAEVFTQSIIDNVLKTTGLIFLLGLTVVGAPLILVIVFVRGFVLGFTVGFLVQETMVKGLILSTTCVLPHNLLVIPALLIGAGGALSFANTAFRSMLGLSKESVPGQLASTTFLTLCSSLLLVAAALVETYLTPIFAQLGSGFFA